MKYKKIMQNQNQFLESMLIRLLDEAKKLSNDKELPVSPEEERSNKTLKKEIEKLIIENKKIQKLRSKNIKIKEDRTQKKARCLTILENNVSDIEDLSKQIESLSLKKQKYKEEIAKLRNSLTKKDEIIKNLKATKNTCDINSGTKDCPHDNIDLREQLDRCKKQYYKKEKSYIKQIEDYKQESQKFKQLYENLKSEKALDKRDQNCFLRSDEPADLHKLTQKLKSLEKELEASTLELAEYEEENKCYCQKIETLLKTIKCLQESKLRSEQDSAEYCERVSRLRTEFQKICEEKNKDIQELNKKLQVMKNHEKEIIDLMDNKDDEIKLLKERIVQLDSDNKRYVVMESKYKECQQEYETYINHLNASQKLLTETYSKLDSCDKIINDLKNRNNTLEEKISELQFSLDEKVNGIANWEIKINELQCANLKLNKELKTKESAIRSLETCLQRSNRILENCEKEMNFVEERNQLFTNEMCQLKSRLEADLLQNQYSTVQCNDMDRDNDKSYSDENSDTEITNLKNKYDDLLTTAAARENDIEYIKSQIVKCFGKEVCQYTPTSGNEQSEIGNMPFNRTIQLGKSLSHGNENHYLKRPESRWGSRMEYQKCKPRSRSPKMSLYFRAKSCPGKKVTHILRVRSFSAPSFCRNWDATTVTEAAMDIINPFSVSGSKSADEYSEAGSLSKHVRGLTVSHKRQQNDVRSVKSDSSLEDNVIKPIEAASSSTSTRSPCTCMTVISRRYSLDRPSRKHCGCR
ncbi:uncharacterized protein [Diabrotica undecimpunctata]|uniref:uncharacterized protein isoform X1 n=1 Tax=Diabrotica undecimpunctata TaxID=50387 RepID=UPI003B631C3C